MTTVVCSANRVSLTVVPENTASGSRRLRRYLEEVAERQIAALATLRAERDHARVARTLAALREAAAGRTNVMPALVEAVKAYATIGEICGVLREVFGEYRVASVY
jgi:methylmalonyl-CoA mutase N-terminal domain/subunit